jgi:bifunctional enzyme CysN/CysC
LSLEVSGSILRFVVCGSVDDGKSTLIGRLLWDTQHVPEDHAAALVRDSQRHGTRGAGNDFALLLDGLQAEREQSITIDVAHRSFATAKRRFVVADAPGHQQYTRNMATAASNAQVAVVLVDASKGLLEQTRRHSRILALMGLQRVAVAVNKMDLVDWSNARFASLEREYLKIAAELGLLEARCVPVCAPYGDNVVIRSGAAPWYRGPTLLEWLETVECSDSRTTAFRMPVQWVNRPDRGFRGLAGRIATGSVRPGDQVVVLPAGVRALVRQIATFDGDLTEAVAGQSITLTLANDVDAGRGDVIAAAENCPPVASQFEASLVWLAESSLVPGRNWIAMLHTRTCAAVVTAIRHRIDVTTGAEVAARTLSVNDIGTVNLSLGQQTAFEPYAMNRRLGAFILIDPVTRNTVAAGMIRAPLRRAANISWQTFAVDRGAREVAKGQRARCIWLTGLPGSGKSTLANLVEQQLMASGHHTFVLDGDNLRHGLNRDLGFVEGDRVENIRRVAEVARLMVDAGLIVIVSVVSPYRADRAGARSLFEAGDFTEVFVDAPLGVCIQRDPKGLYAKAMQGVIPNLTGLGGPYEVPDCPDLHLLTANDPPEVSAAMVLDYLQVPR